MSIRPPLGLSFALAALVLAQSGARAEPPAGTWTDPPAKSAPRSAPEPSAPNVEPAEPPRAEGVKKRGAGSAVSAAAPAPGGSVTWKPIRAARAPAPRRAVAARPARRPEAVVRRAPVRPVRVARPLHRDWPPAEPVYATPRAYDPRDPRLERLWSAEEAGYLAVRGRHVAYPDGRVLRVYRPGRDDEDLD